MEKKALVESVNEYIDYDIKVKQLVRQGVLSFVFTDADKIQRDKLLNKEIPIQQFRDYLVKRLIEHLKTQSVFEEIVITIREYEIKNGRVPHSIQEEIDRKIVAHLAMYADEKINEYLSPYEGSFDRKPMVTRGLIQ